MLVMLDIEVGWGKIPFVSITALVLIFRLHTKSLSFGPLFSIDIIIICYCDIFATKYKNIYREKPYLGGWRALISPMWAVVQKALESSARAAHI